MSEATDVVDRQIAAFRDRDLERFRPDPLGGQRPGRREAARGKLGQEGMKPGRIFRNPSGGGRQCAPEIPPSTGMTAPVT